MNLETLLFSVSLYGLLLCVLFTVVCFFVKRIRNKKKGIIKDFIAAEKLAILVSILCLAIITAFIIARTVRTGHGPFSNMYEFSIAFVWGILLISIVFSWKYRNIIIILLGTIVAAGLMFFANSLSAEAAPLVPALQNSLLLSVHVFSAIVAYGAFTVGFIASILFLVQKNGQFLSLPDLKTLEKISYHSVIVGFPFMTLVIVLGAIWADIAWGRFWGWDPKETASLVTWLIYAVYMHTRILAKWKGKKSAFLLLIGFIAVAFTFFGNYIFNGLHSYL